MNNSESVTNHQPTVYISACEPSGDVLGSELVAEMKKHFPHFHFFGVAGPLMRAQGVEPLALMEDFSVMGFVEVIRHLPVLQYQEQNLIELVDRKRPLFAILIDYPGFHLRFARMLKSRHIPVIQYVAPQLWAWGERRTKKLREVTDHVFGIMPFEQEFFAGKGVSYTYVGTPQVDRALLAVSMREAWNMHHQELFVGFFPGSRVSEVKRLIPIMAETREQMRRLNPKLNYVFSLAPALNLTIFESMDLLLKEQLHDFRYQIKSQGYYQAGDTWFVRGHSVDLMKSVDTALVTSGTATLECALCDTPMAVIYTMNPLSYKIAKRLVKLPFISLVNLVAQKKVVSEFIQDFSCLDVARHLLALVEDGNIRKSQKQDLQALKAHLKGSLAQEVSCRLKEIFSL